LIAKPISTSRNKFFFRKFPSECSIWHFDTLDIWNILSEILWYLDFTLHDTLTLYKIFHFVHRNYLIYTYFYI
jgi:hypothetical protein